MWKQKWKLTWTLASPLQVRRWRGEMWSIRNTADDFCCWLFQSWLTFHSARVSVRLLVQLEQNSFQSWERSHSNKESKMKGDLCVCVCVRASLDPQIIFKWTSEIISLHHADHSTTPVSAILLLLLSAFYRFFSTFYPRSLFWHHQPPKTTMTEFYIHDAVL